MKNRFLSFTTICIAIIVFASCEKPVSQLALYVPKDASAVFTVDTKAIMDKIASSGITIDSLANIFSKEDDDYALHWSDIKNSGVDLDHPFYFFSKQTNSVQAGDIKSFALIAQVQDEKKLETFFKKERVGGDVLSGGKYKYISLGNDFIAGWTDKILIVSNVTGGDNSHGNYSTGEGMASQLQLTTLFTQNESASIASAGDFREILARPGDIHFYTNISANLGSMAMLGMTKANSLLEGSFTGGTINFENGKIIASSETHNSKALSDILEKYPSREIDKGMVANYPDTLAGFGIIAFNPKVLMDILHYLGFDGIADGFASDLGFTVNDVVNAFSGDIAIMFSGNAGKMPEKTAPGNFMPEKHNGSFLANFAVGDKAAFDKVIAGLVNKNIITKNGDYYQLGILGGHNFVIAVTNNSLLIGSGEELLQAYQSSNKKSPLPPDIDKELNDKSMALYIDFAGLFNNGGKDSSMDLHLHDTYFILSNNIFKNFVATTEKSDSKIIKGNLELNFINTGENSLASLAKFIAIMHKQEMERKNNWTAYPPSSEPGKADSL